MNCLFTSQIIFTKRSIYIFKYFSFRWGIGTKPGLDNVMTFRNFPHTTIHSCAEITLKHNTKYYSTLIVFNAALNSKDSNSSSNGGELYIIYLAYYKYLFLFFFFLFGIKTQSLLRFLSISLGVYLVFFLGKNTVLQHYRINNISY